MTDPSAPHPFTDPVDGAECVVHFGAAPGVEHPGCRYRATVHPDLDAWYCTECGRTGRIAGAWFLDLLERNNQHADRMRRAIQVAEATWPHYFSTYCIHDQHPHCRLTCKICAAPCRCPCHIEHP